MGGGGGGNRERGRDREDEQEQDGNKLCTFATLKMQADAKTELKSS